MQTGLFRYFVAAGETRMASSLFAAYFWHMEKLMDVERNLLLTQ